MAVLRSTYESGTRWFSTAWLRHRVGRRLGRTAQSRSGTGVFENRGSSRWRLI
jgi:hypothetical protein